MKQGGHSHALSSADWLHSHTSAYTGDVVHGFHSGKIGEIKGEG